jgi:succinate dehydrogenase subunit D
MAEGAGEFDARYNPGHEAIRVEAGKTEAEGEVNLEPLLWGLFSLGGFLTAFLLPATIVAISFLVPLGLWSPDRIGYAWMQGALNPAAASFQGLIVRLFFLLVIAGSLFHGAHRFTYMVGEALGHRGEQGVSLVLHGLAAIGSVLALYYVLLGWLL